MLWMGDRIHIRDPHVRRALEKRDAAAIQGLAREQAAAGAEALQLAIGPQPRHGPELMAWLVDAVQQAVDLPLALDTPNLTALEAGVRCLLRPGWIGTASAEPERLAPMARLAAQHGVALVAVPLLAEGLPLSATDRLHLVRTVILPAAAASGLSPDRVYIDPPIVTMAGVPEYAAEALATIAAVKRLPAPTPHTIATLANIADNMPAEGREELLRSYEAQIKAAGLDVMRGARGVKRKTQNVIDELPCS